MTWNGRTLCGPAARDGADLPMTGNGRTLCGPTARDGADLPMTGNGHTAGLFVTEPFRATLSIEGPY
jgi:hypothetical protein